MDKEPELEPTEIVLARVTGPIQSRSGWKCKNTPIETHLALKPESRTGPVGIPHSRTGPVGIPKSRTGPVGISESRTGPIGINATQNKPNRSTGALQETPNEPEIAYQKKGHRAKIRQHSAGRLRAGFLSIRHMDMENPYGISIWIWTVWTYGLRMAIWISK